MARKIPTPRKILSVLPPGPPGLMPTEIAGLVCEPRPTVAVACRRLWSERSIRRSARPDRRGVWRYWLPTREPEMQVQAEQR